METGMPSGLDQRNTGSGCQHPVDRIIEGPRIPRVYGSGPTQVCGICESWRTHFQPGLHGAWRPAETLTDAMEEDDER